MVWGIHVGGFWEAVALEGPFLDREEVWDPVVILQHRELLEGVECVIGVCDGLVVEVHEVDGGFRGRGPVS